MMMIHRRYIDVRSFFVETFFEMLPALGHCEDVDCQSVFSSSSHEFVRLFRCSIHCDRNLCLYHLNAHDVYYEDEKKQNHIAINELQNHLNLYQTIFEQQISAYRELVRQASSILLYNTSSLVPVEQIRTITEKLQQAIEMIHEEQIIIKCESILEPNDIENNIGMESGQKVVVRIPRIDCNQSHNQVDDENEEQQTSSLVRKVVDGMRKKSLPPIKRLQK